MIKRPVASHPEGKVTIKVTLSNADIVWLVIKTATFRTENSVFD
jgi:hypothetical protein